MATRFDPFQEIDRLFGQLLTAERSSATMPLDLYRSGDHYVLHMDLPGADPGSIDVNVEDRTLTIRAQRTARPEARTCSGWPRNGPAGRTRVS